MKVISLLQPWASLVVLGHKRIETRSWNTKHRGPLLIHASAGKSGLNLIDKQDPFGELATALLKLNLHFEDYPLGAIIGHVKVMETFPTSIQICKGNYVNAQLTYNDKRELDVSSSCVYMTPQEEAFGNYAPGRYGWLLSDPIQFDKPIPAKGSLSIWEFQDAEIKNAVI